MNKVPDMKKASERINLLDHTFPLMMPRMTADTAKQMAPMIANTKYRFDFRSTWCWVSVLSGCEEGVVCPSELEPR